MLCGVHCATFAFLPGVAASLGVAHELGETLEWGFFAAAVLFAALALFAGWRRHKSRAVAGLLFAGIAALVAARTMEVVGVEGGSYLSIGAATLLVCGHILGLRKLSSARQCEAHEAAG